MKHMIVHLILRRARFHLWVGGLQSGLQKRKTSGDDLSYFVAHGLASGTKASLKHLLIIPFFPNDLFTLL